MSEREHFASRATAVMAMAGSAIGLGNIWRFPYIVGQNGGSAFVIAYLVFCVMLSMPIFFAESIIGRASGSNTFGAMKKMAPGTNWKWLGLLTVLSPLIILSFYSVVGGWSVQYLGRSIISGFADLGFDEMSQIFSSSITATWNPIVFHTIFILLCTVIVSAGVKDGIERFNKISMPLLLILIVVIMVYSISLPGAGEGVKYLVKPDFSKLTPSALASAMGQSFFSLSLGVGTILTYSSYMRKEENMLVSGFGTAFFDLVFAMIAGFAIMPAVFSAGIEPGAGPGLIFETLPYVFSKMGAAAPLLSRVIAIVFFITIVVAALTSAISMFEVGVAYLVEEKNINRKKATAIIFGGSWLLGVCCSLSYGPWSGFHILGKNIFDFCDSLTSNYLMAFGGLLFVIFVGWKMEKKRVFDEFTNNGSIDFNKKVFNLLFFFIKYIVPFAIITIFVTNLII